MLRSQVQQATGLTRKAIEYYEDKGLIQPDKDQQGYRNYSAKEIEQLKQIALYRKLGLNLEEISELLTDPTSGSTILRQQQYQVELNYQKNELLSQLIRGHKPEIIRQALETIEKSESIYQRLMRIFPGYFGQALFAAYQPFFTKELAVADQSAFNQYIEYLIVYPTLTLQNRNKHILNK